jgi:hypothetical protein
VGAHGKPALIDRADAAGRSESIPGTRTPLSFNTSHSGWVALYAFTRTGEVGVDIELAREPIDAVALAGRAFGAAEARRLARLDPAIRQQEFLRAWTRHEAKLKHLGIGIGGGAASAREPLVAQLGIGQGAAGAVAIGRSTRELRCWEYGPTQPGGGARWPGTSLRYRIATNVITVKCLGDASGWSRAVALGARERSL